MKYSIAKPATICPILKWKYYIKFLIRLLPRVTVRLVFVSTDRHRPCRKIGETYDLQSPLEVQPLAQLRENE